MLGAASTQHPFIYFNAGIAQYLQYFYLFRLVLVYLQLILSGVKKYVGAVKRQSVYLFTPERPILQCNLRCFRSEEETMCLLTAPRKAGRAVCSTMRISAARLLQSRMIQPNITINNERITMTTIYSRLLHFYLKNEFFRSEEGTSIDIASNSSLS